MPLSRTDYEPQRIGGEVERFWRSRGLPPANGILGPPDGPVLHQLEGGLVPSEEASFLAYRVVAADVDARYLALVGRRAEGTLRWERPSEGPNGPPQAELLRKLAIWTGGTGGAPWDAEDRHPKVERIVGRLARKGVIVSRDLPLRLCPTCVAPRSPERIIYQEEEGTAHLIRFDLPIDERVVHALVWVDAPWRLLGTSALLVHPDAPYVIARYRRRAAEEIVLTSRSSLERFRDWLPDASFELLEERPGREFVGKPYLYPLRHEFPMGGNLTPPGGTVLAAADVTATGTGIVPLVPGHQSTDAVIAESLGVPGWPLVTPRGRLDVTLVHKYAGLDLKTASEFVVRDLTENGAVFADLRVRRGVPHCMICGSPLIWFPGRAWCLEPGRLPPETVELYRRLLPGAPSLHRVEVAPWPVSETTPSEEPSAVALLECSACERLDALDGPAACPCGGKMYPARRRLVPSALNAFGAWGRLDPFPATDPVRLYVGERRRVPALVHHLAGSAGIEGTPSGYALSVLPTLPEIDLAALLESEGADAVRAALVRTGGGEATRSTFRERCAQERRRVERLWAAANALFDRLDTEMTSAFLEPIAGLLGELETEDRALLARWERTRVLAIADYDRGAAASVHRRVFRFLETDLAEYRRWVAPRLELSGGPVAKRSVLRTLHYVLRTAVVLLGPILPYTSEAIHRRFTGDRRSLFESGVGAVERSLLQEGLAAAWERWRSLLNAVARFRSAYAIAAATPIATAAVAVATDEAGDRMREARPLLERLGRIGRLEVGSPKEPWQGRQKQVRPIESEIQRVYPSQASQIAHLLRRMPPRRPNEAAGSTELSVVIQGLPKRVSPKMVDYVDTLPKGMVPTPWGLGELYLELPGAGRTAIPAPPPLSPDAFWLVRRVERRLRQARGAREAAPRSLVVVTTDPLASELRGVAEPLARYLDLAEVRVAEKVAEPPPPHRIRGRSRTGARWWVDIPGLPVPPRHPKGRIVRPSSRRVPAHAPSDGGPEFEVDYADEGVIAEEEAVRSLNRELDALLRRPILGPSKVRAARARGFQDLARFRSATMDEILALPGFGRGCAEALVDALQGDQPRSTPRTPVRTVPHAAGERPHRTHRGPQPSPRPATTAPVTRPSVEGVLSGPPPPTEFVPPAPASPTLPPAPPPRASPETTGLSQEPGIELPPSGPLPPPEVEGPPPAAPALPPASPPLALPEKTATPPPAEPIPLPEGAQPTVPLPMGPASEGPAPEEAAPSTPPAEPATAEGTTGPVPEALTEPSAETTPAEPANLPSERPAPSAVGEAESREEPLPAPPENLPEGTPALDSVPPAVEIPEEPMPAPLPEPSEVPPSVPAEPSAVPEEAHDAFGSGGEGGEPPVEEGEPAPSEASAPFPSSTLGPTESSGRVEIPEPTPPLTEESPSAPEPSVESEAGPSASEPVPEAVTVTIEPEPPTVSVPPTPSEIEAATPIPPSVLASEAPSEEDATPVPLSPAPVPAPETPAEIERSDAERPSPGSPEPPTEAPEPTEPTATPSDAAPSEGPPRPAVAPSPAPEELAPEAPETPPPAVAPTSASLAEPPVESPAETSTEPLNGPVAPATPVVEEPPAVLEPVAPPTVEPPPAPVPPPRRGGIELMIGPSVVTSLQPFLEATAAGLPGVCIVRESPERIRAHAGTRPIEIYWLTNLGRGKTVRPNDLPGFAAFLVRAINEEHIPLFFIEGIEYLSHIHGIEAVVTRLAELDRFARDEGIRVWVHVTPGLLRPHELDRIAEAFPPAP